MSTTHATAPASEKVALHKALADAQAAFPTITKGKKAVVQMKGGGSYSYAYADLGDVLNAVRGTLHKHGLSVSQPLGVTDSGAPVLRTLLMHIDGGVIESVLPIGTAPTNAQAFGGALTYLRRYALTALLGIATEEDADGQPAADPKANEPKTVGGITQARARRIVEGAQRIGVDSARLKLKLAHVRGGVDIGDISTKGAAVESLRALTADQADEVETWLQNEADAAETA